MIGGANKQALIVASLEQKGFTMTSFSRRRALLVGPTRVFTLNADVTRAQPSADSKWKMGSPLPKPREERVGVAID